MRASWILPFFTCLACLGLCLFALSETNAAFRQMGEPADEFESTIAELRETDEMFTGQRVATTLENLAVLSAEERQVTRRLVNFSLIVLAGGYALIALQTLAIAYLSRGEANESAAG